MSAQRSGLWRAANGLMLLAFLASVAVQYNDPDPLRWVVIYGAAALACARAVTGRSGWILPALVGAAALVWALSLAPGVLGRVGFGELFEAFEMKDVRVEVGREFGGLMIIVGWMAVLLLAWRAGARTPAASQPPR
ncbi:MAG: transmembrane 220 family protein [Gemmatimonadota bacterium]|jgi:hypothetical protein